MILYRNSRYGLTLLEFIIALTIIGIFVATMLTFINMAAIHAKEEALQLELRNFRLSLDLYKITKDSYPKDLRALLQARYKLKDSGEFLFGERFLDSVERDSEGYPLDPFKNRYNYDSGKGVIKSGTKGYEKW